MNKNILKDNLISLRKEKGLTQKDLSEKLNYSDKVISKWERGESVPDIDALNQIALFYNISIDQLVSSNLTYQSNFILGSNQIHYEFTKAPSRILIHSIWLVILLYIYLGFHFMLNNIYLYIITTILFIIYTIVHGTLIQRAEVVATYEGHEIKVMHKSTKASLYIDQVLVDEIDNSWIITFKLTGKIENKLLKVNINSFALRRIKMFIE